MPECMLVKGKGVSEAIVRKRKSDAMLTNIHIITSTIPVSE